MCFVHCRAAAQAYDRNLVCTGHANEQDCNRDTANRCMYWSKSCVGADAFEVSTETLMADKHYWLHSYQPAIAAAETAVLLMCEQQVSA